MFDALRKTCLREAEEASCAAVMPCIWCHTVSGWDPNGIVKWYKPPQLNEYSLHGEVALPLDQTWQLSIVDLSVSRIDAWQVNLGYEDDLWRGVRVVWAADYSQAVDSILMDALCIALAIVIPEGG